MVLLLNGRLCRLACSAMTHRRVARNVTHAAAAAAAGATTGGDVGDGGGGGGGGGEGVGASDQSETVGGDGGVALGATVGGGEGTHGVHYEQTVRGGSGDCPRPPVHNVGLVPRGGALICPHPHFGGKCVPIGAAASSAAGGSRDLVSAWERLFTLTQSRALTRPFLSRSAVHPPMKSTYFPPVKP